MLCDAYVFLISLLSFIILDILVKMLLTKFLNRTHRDAVYTVVCIWKYFITAVVLDNQTFWFSVFWLKLAPKTGLGEMARKGTWRTLDTSNKFYKSEVLSPLLNGDAASWTTLWDVLGWNLTPFCLLQASQSRVSHNTALSHAAVVTIRRQCLRSFEHWKLCINA